MSYTPRTQPGFHNPAADAFLLTGRWAHLRALTLSTLWCTPHAGPTALAAFLAAHPALETLHLDISFGAGNDAAARGAPLKLAPGSLPRLRELRASRDVVVAVLTCPFSDPEVDEGVGAVRPLETIKGVRLGGPVRDRAFLDSLRAHGQTVRRLELAGWNDMEDVRRLVECVPRLTWLDLGRRTSTAMPGAAATGAAATSHATAKAAVAHVVPNPVRTLYPPRRGGLIGILLRRANGPRSSKSYRTSPPSTVCVSSTPSPPQVQVPTPSGSRSQTAAGRARTTRSRACSRGAARSCAVPITGRTARAGWWCSCVMRSGCGTKCGAR